MELEQLRHFTAAAEAGEALLPQAQSLLDAAEKIKDGMKNARPAN